MQISGSLFIAETDKPMCSRSSGDLHMIRWGGVSIHGTESQLFDLFCELGRHIGGLAEGSEAKTRAEEFRTGQRVRYVETSPGCWHLDRSAMLDTGDLLESMLTEDFAPYREA